jgi:hypothetical protein
MRRFLFLLAVAAIPAAAQWRHFGQSELQTAGFVGIGPSTGANPLARQVDTGWNLAGGVGVTQGYAGVMVDALYTDFGITHSALLRQGAHDGSRRFWAVTVDPVVHINPRGPADFYLTAGGGLYGQRNEVRSSFISQGGAFDLIRTDIVYKGGVDAGAGFSFQMDPRSRLKFFAEARYHHMFTSGSGDSFIPVTVGVRF